MDFCGESRPSGEKACRHLEISGHLEEPGFSDRSGPDRGEVLVEDGDLIGGVVGRWFLAPFG
jgi:hypothetical protein